mgnify:CR=1 FL=1
MNRKAKNEMEDDGNSRSRSCRLLLAASLITFLVAVLVKQTDRAPVFYTFLLLIFLSVNCLTGILKKYFMNNRNLYINNLTGLWLALCFFTDSVLLNVFAMGTYLFYSKLISMMSIAKKNLHPDTFFRSVTAGAAANATTYLLVLMLDIFTVK